MEFLQQKPAGDILREFKAESESLLSSNNPLRSTDHQDAGGFVEDQNNDAMHPDGMIPGEDFEYDMKNEKRGCFIIFVHDKFDESLGADPRGGSMKDATKMKQVAMSMGFDHIRVCPNFDKKDILGLLDLVRQGDHMHYDCFGCAILSHGEQDDVIYAQDQKMSLKDFMEPFNAKNCPTLGGKPKLFFIQACRGRKFDKPTKVYRRVQCDAMLDDEKMEESPHALKEDLNLQTMIIPSQADFMIAHATPQDYTAWRNDIAGSWFIDALHWCFNNYSQELDVIQIMTKVNNRLAGTKIKGRSVMQISSVVNQLRAEVRFEPKTPELPRTEPMVTSGGQPLRRVCCDSFR